MEKKHAMTIRRFIATSVLTILATALVAVPLSFALEVDFDMATTDSDAAEGDVTQDQCANLDESLAAAMGCQTSDQISDFTEYTGKLEGPDASGYDDALTKTTSARDFIQTIVNFALSFLGLVATVIVIYGGIMYVLSRGDEEMASKGKKAIGYAAIGIVLVLASFALVNTLLSATGGGSESIGGGAEGTTITEAGASFDVDGVQNELVSIMNEYLDTYETFLYSSQEVAYLQSVEMPLIVTVAETDKTLSGYIEYGIELLNGTDEELTDDYVFIDQNDIDAYLEDLRSGIQKIQGNVDSLSDTYQAGQILYNYLRSGTSSTSGIFKLLSVLIAPNADAASETDDEKTSCAKLEMDGGEYTSYDPATIALALGLGGGVAGDGLAAYDTITGNANEWWQITGNVLGGGAVSIWNTGVGTTAYDTQVSYIDDAICPMLEVINYAAETDYQGKVDELIGRIDDLKDLFDTSSVAPSYTSGSSLYQIVNALNSTRYYLESAHDRISNSTVRDIVASINELYTMIENIEFVRVRLTASAVSGNSPLIVRFNALGTEDPSGLTVQNEQIEWDLDGDGVFTDDTYDENGNVVGAATSYTYTQAGTYRARVRVTSSDTNIAAGVAMVTIKVEPSKSVLVLTAQAGTDDPDYLADFRTYPSIDKNTYKVTMAEGQGGITFDASQSTDGNGNADGLIFAEWDFGDNETTSGSWAQYSSVTHAYGKQGTYDVSLTVTDETGVKDHKYFKLYVASPAARLYTYPNSGEVGTTFKFDASASSTDLGTIVNYKWSASLDGAAYTLTKDTGSVINETFTEPGIYTITLTVTDSSNNSDSISTNVLVESQAPVATFEYQKPSSNYPAIVVFDATDSYDPDKGDTISYQWEINGEQGKDYEITDGTLTSEKMTVQFLKVDSFNVKLTVADNHEAELQKSASITKTINITSILDVDMEVQGENARHLDANGESEVEFYGYSKNATAFEINYGDGSTDFTETISNGQSIFTHTYERAGVFYAELTAYDDNGNTNSITHRVYIAAGDTPIAVINVTANGEDIGFGESLVGSVKTQFTFDAGESLNVDGSKNNLKYSWNFGDGKTASQSKVTHVFSELATYTVVLTVTDENDATVTSESFVYINIQGIPPRIKGITVVPQGSSLETPLKVNLNVDASDEDGKITYVKAWYYDVNDSSTQLGTVIAQSTSLNMTVNTKGEAGQQVTYGFAVEVTDNSNNIVSSFEQLSTDNIPTLTVTNGPNENPVANFSVDRSSVFVGEEVIFSSTSYDPDGEIAYYWWDIEGDGFYNNEPTTEDSFTYAFQQVHSDGINVQLKVEDNTGATATSEGLTIYVDSLAAAPEAKFLAYVDGTSVTFKNNSAIDEENGASLAAIYWDLDLNMDSDGNGIKNDDMDSLEENPTYDYQNFGNYSVKMTVVDSMGQTDSVEQTITVANSVNPTADFSFTVDDKEATFKNLSSVDEANGAALREYTWDFDINSEDDVNSSVTHPTFEYSKYGTYSVKLTVTDTLGKTDSVTKTVEVSSPIESVQALLTSMPQPNESGQIESATSPVTVTFYYGAEGGSDDYTYQFDQNIFYDSDGDGVKDNDANYKTTQSGTWQSTYYESYGQIVVKLTVTDNETGDKDTSTLQIVFPSTIGGANLLAMTPNTFIIFILTALAAVLFGASLTYKSQIISK